MSKRFYQQNVIITGGSSGIGLAVAAEFAALQAHLFLIGRNEDKLVAAKNQLIQQFGPQLQVNLFQADVGIREQIEPVIRKIGDEMGGIHTLINNAGNNHHGRFEENEIHRFEEIFQTNYFGALYPTKLAWEYLKKAENSHLGFVSSVAGYTGLIGLTIYAPTKFALNGLAECLRMEGNDYGIRVSVLYPPDTDTPLMDKANREGNPDTKALSKNAKLMQPSEVARIFIRGMLDNRFEILCNGTSRLIRIIKGISPGLYYWIVDYLLRKDRLKRV